MDIEKVYRKESMIFSYILQEEREKSREAVFFSEVCGRFNLTGDETIRSLNRLEDANLVESKIAFIGGRKWERVYSITKKGYFIVRQE